MRDLGSWNGVQRATHHPDETYRLFIAGEWVPSRTVFEAVDPTVGTAWATIPEAGREQVEDAVEAARKAFTDWRRSSLATRQEALWRMADRIGADPDRWAALLATEGGRPVRESYISDIPACVAALRHFSGLTRSVHGEQVPVEDPYGLVYTVRSPLGVLVIDVPWNTPLIALADQIGPALAAGNTIVVHPAGPASATVLEFAQAVEDLLPAGVLNVVTGLDSGIAEYLDGHPDTMAVARPDRRLDGLESAAGGTMIIFPDADLDAAVTDTLTGVCIAGGDSGMAPSLVLVHQRVHEEFTARLATMADAVVLGDPLDLSTEMGPLISGQRREEVRDALRRSLAGGARLVGGGDPSRLPGGLARGFFHAPTVLIGGEKTKGARTRAVQVLPGPATITESFDDERQVVDRVNSAAPGHVAGVWTTDLARGHRVARELRAGLVWINRWSDSPADFPMEAASGSAPGLDVGERLLARYCTAKVVGVDLGSRRPPLWGGGA